MVGVSSDIVSMEAGAGMQLLEAELGSENGSRAEADFKSWRAVGSRWREERKRGCCREGNSVCVDRNGFHTLFCPECCDSSETAPGQKEPPLPVHAGQRMIERPLWKRHGVT